MSFATCQEIERESLKRLHPWLEFNSDGRYVLTHKGRLGRILQEQVGDILLNGKSGGLWSIECKAEERNDHHNFFLESWSNKSRFNPGWLWKIDADVLLYHFLNAADGYETDEIYVMRFAELRRWCFETIPTPEGSSQWRICRWSERRQNKHSQLNDTWGFCVPIKAVLHGVKSAKRIYLPETELPRAATR